MTTVRTGDRPEIETAAGSPSRTTPAPPRAPVTIRTLVKMVQCGEPFACLTCYDATTARWLERAGVPVLLVGDTVAEMVLGLPREPDVETSYHFKVTRREE